MTFATLVVLCLSPLILCDEEPQRGSVEAIEYLGQALLPGNATLEGTRVGGLSGLAFDESKGIFLAISDDKGGPGMPAPRVYRLRIDLKDGKLSQGRVRVESYLMLTRSDGMRVAEGSVDGEGIVLRSGEEIIISAEGIAGMDSGVPPSVDRFDARTGRFRRGMAVPQAYRPASNPKRGVRGNLGFESLTITPSGRLVDTATENALEQDGPSASAEEGSPCRILRFDAETGEPVAEYVYEAEPIVGKEGARLAGLVELLALDESRWLALERSYSTGTGFSIRLYEASIEGATNVLGVEALSGREGVVPVSKRLLLDLGTIPGLIVSNLEGMAFGPLLSDDRRSLILVGYNNLNVLIPTQFLAFGVTLNSEPVLGRSSP